MERRKFEESWKDAFDQAELSPSENLWTNIELDLEKAKGTRLKRTLLFYQSLAAASVVFALGIGIYLVDANKTSELLAVKQEATQGTENEVPQTAPSDSKNKGTASGLNTEEETSRIENSPSENDARGNIANASNTKTTFHKKSGQATGNTVYFYSENENKVKASAEQEVEALFAPFPERELPVLAQVGKIDLDIVPEQPKPDPVALMMARLEEREREMKEQGEKKKEEEDKGGENFWTSVGFAAGSFNTVNSGASSSSFNNSQAANATALASVADNETKASGITYSMGVNVGTKLSERWVIQGGVNYLTQASEYTQEVLIVNQDFTEFRPANINDFNKLPEGDATARAEKLVTTAPHNVDNDVRYLSIPMQAGYLILNRDFGVQLNAGISTDLFLQNTITATANGEKVDPSKADLSEDSAFRPVNLSGLMGTELSYKFGEHYRIAINPGLRYPFNSIYKSDDYKATRLSFDVGLRFRYIFH